MWTVHTSDKRAMCNGKIICCFIAKRQTVYGTRCKQMNYTWRPHICGKVEICRDMKLSLPILRHMKKKIRRIHMIIMLVYVGLHCYVYGHNTERERETRVHHFFLRYPFDRSFLCVMLFVCFLSQLRTYVCMEHSNIIMQYISTLSIFNRQIPLMYAGVGHHFSQHVRVCCAISHSCG